MNQMIEIDVPAMSVETGTVAMLAAAEIDQQIATAKKYRRSLQAFRQEALEMVTLNEEIAQECIYSLPRGKEVIEGPSARFAEIIISAWGNCRSGARIVNEGAQFVTAQGVCHDLQRNVALTYEVQRRITDRNGNRYSPDMIGVTANAASSIALRNAILKVVPKAFWNDIYLAARKTIMGDFKTLANRRDNAIKAFVPYGISSEQIFETLGVKGIEDIGGEELVTLSGLLTAIKEGDTTPEQAFGKKDDTQHKAPPPPPADKKPATQTEPDPQHTSQPDQTANPAAPGAAERAAPPPPDPGAAPTQNHGAPPPPPPAEKQAAPAAESQADMPIEPDAFIAEMDGRMGQAQSEDDVLAVWHEMTPEDVLEFPGDLSRADAIKESHRDRFRGNR